MPEQYKLFPLNPQETFDWKRVERIVKVGGFAREDYRTITYPETGQHELQTELH